MELNGYSTNVSIRLLYLFYCSGEALESDLLVSASQQDRARIDDKRKEQLSRSLEHCPETRSVLPVIHNEVK